MRVRVLVAGVYNGPDHKDPVRAQPGDVIEVAGGWYAAELMEKGLVTVDEPAASVAPHVAAPRVAEPQETQEASGPAETPARTKRPSGRPSTALRSAQDAWTAADASDHPSTPLRSAQDA